MIRRYHRWLAILFGLFLVWIAATGLMSHAAALVRDAQGPAATAAPGAAIIPTAQAHEGMPDNAAANAAAASATPAGPAGFVCPDNMTCRVKPHPDSAAAWVSYLHHLHAGEEFGVTGTILSIASGFALLFFALSGLWMYLDLFRGRRARPARNGDKARFFWK